LLQRVSEKDLLKVEEDAIYIDESGIKQEVLDEYPDTCDPENDNEYSSTIPEHALTIGKKTL
jgi:hypothetical protein